MAALPFNIKKLELLVTTHDETAPQLRLEEIEPDLFLLHLRLERGGESFEIPRFQIAFNVPIVDIHGIWHVDANRETTACLPQWNVGFLSQATVGAPVFSLFNHGDQNRLTCALGDAAREVKVNIALSEELAALKITLERFPHGQIEHATHYEDTLRLDFRTRHFSQNLREVSQWWAGQSDKTPASVPDAAREPVLSTWYSMHQHVSPAAIERECALSRELGCRVVIVDDGWQTASNERGYGFCGDWEIDEGKMPDMAAHVARVQELGLKYVLWIAPLFMGDHMKNHARFKDKFLYRRPEMHADVLDPRFPDVRAYLVETFVRLMRELNLDGFKIDFVDLVKNTPPQLYARTGEGRNIQNIPQAMDALLIEMTKEFRAFKPDFLCEFRQSYVGPLMRKYGNMFRANDCPNDFERNRFRTIAVRLLSGHTPAHADMFLWHPHDTPQNAARQLLASLFAVPQISVKLETIAPAHRETLHHWLTFWNAHRDVLLAGDLLPCKPHLGFPVVGARRENSQIVAVYDDVLVPFERAPAPELLLVNAGFRRCVVLECAHDFGAREATYFDLNGREVGSNTLQLVGGALRVEVPVCGYARLRVAPTTQEVVEATKN